MKTLSIALVLAAAFLVGASKARAGHGHGAAHGGIGHPGIGHPGRGIGTFHMHPSVPFSAYRGPGARGWAHGYGNYYRHRGRGFVRVYPYYYGGYGYGGGCASLYALAVGTDSPYWWERYYDCIGY